MVICCVIAAFGVYWLDQSTSDVEVTIIFVTGSFSCLLVYWLNQSTSYGRIKIPCVPGRCPLHINMEADEKKYKNNLDLKIAKRKQRCRSSNAYERDMNKFLTIIYHNINRLREDKMPMKEKLQ